MLHHPLERGRPQQRDVARQQYQCPAATLQGRFGLEQGVAGPKLRLLECKPQARPFLQRHLDLIGAVADDDHGGRWGKRVSDPKHVLDQADACNFVEDLGARGPHPGTFTGGEDGDVGVRHGAPGSDRTESVYCDRSYGVVAQPRRSLFAGVGRRRPIRSGASRICRNPSRTRTAARSGSCLAFDLLSGLSSIA